MLTSGAGRDARLPIAYLSDTFHAKGAAGAYHTTYYPQATYISSRQYYFHVEGYNYIHMDFRNDHYHEIVFQVNFVCGLLSEQNISFN